MKKRVKSGLGLLLTLTICVTLFAGYTGSALAEGTDVIKVGVICPTTGDVAFLGEAIKKLVEICSGGAGQCRRH